MQELLGINLKMDEKEAEIINKVALCCNDKCGRRKVCMRYTLQGNANDTWVVFKPVKFAGKIICRQFVHVDSEQAKKYILKIYGDKFGGKISK